MLLAHAVTARVKYRTAQLLMDALQDMKISYINFESNKRAMGVVGSPPPASVMLWWPFWHKNTTRVALQLGLCGLELRCFWGRLETKEKNISVPLEK